MKPEHLRSAVAEELERAQVSLKSARLLTENGLFSDAVSRLYYYALYHVRALLLTVDLEPRSHEAALRLFGLHFVKNGSLAPAASHLFSRLMKYREEADYNPSYVFDRSDVDQLFEDTMHVTEQIRALIVASGFPVE